MAVLGRGLGAAGLLLAVAVGLGGNNDAFAQDAECEAGQAAVTLRVLDGWPNFHATNTATHCVYNAPRDSGTFEGVVDHTGAALALQKCSDAGWLAGVSNHRANTCLIFTRRGHDNGESNECNVPGGTGGDEECILAFGSDFNFPQNPSNSATGGPRYVYDCDPDEGNPARSTGAVPAGPNTGGANAETACSCPNPHTTFNPSTRLCECAAAGEFVIGDALTGECGVCSAGQIGQRHNNVCGACGDNEYSLAGACVMFNAKCFGENIEGTGLGWAGTNNGGCTIPVRNVAGGVDYDYCLSPSSGFLPANGGTNPQPSCAEVFGGNFDAPTRAEHVAGTHYVYNCPGGSTPNAERTECVSARPGKPQVTVTPEHRVSISWAPPGNAGPGERYDLLRSDDAGDSFMTLTMGVTERSYVDEDFEVSAGGVQFIYQVRAGEELSENSDPARVPYLDCAGMFRERAERGTCAADCLGHAVEVGGECLLNAASEVRASLLADHAVSLWWAAAPGAATDARYEVVRVTLGAREVELGRATVAAVAALSYRDAGVATGSTVRYQLRLEGGDPGSPRSLSEASRAVVIARLNCEGEFFRLPGERGSCLDECVAHAVEVGEDCLLNAAMNVTATVLADHAVSVSWEAAPGAGTDARYEIVRATVGGSSASVAATTGLFYRDDGVAGGTTVRYRLRLESAEAGTTLSLSRSSNAVVIPQLPCGELMRLPGARGLCGACDDNVAHALPDISNLELPDVCIKQAPTEPGDVEFVNDEATLCEAFGGVLQDADGGRQVCSEVDAADTFCIIDAADLGNAFACRGLFKHVRQCNFIFRRPALNPFLCGPRCAPDGKVIGMREEDC